MKTLSFVKTSAIVRSFFSEFFKNKWFYGSVGATLIAQSAYTLDTYITAQIVDHLRLFFVGETTAKEVYRQFFLLISIGAITWTFWRINEYAINRFQIQVAKKVYEKIFVHTHHHSSQYFADNFAGSIFKRISRYVRTFEDFSDTIIARILPILVHLGATVIVVFSFSTLGGWIVVFYVVFFCWVSFLLVRWQHPLIDKHDRIDSQFSGYVTDTIGNHSTILSFGQFGQERKKFQKKCHAAYDALYQVWARGRIVYGTLGVISFLNYWTVTGFALYLALNGQLVFASFLVINTYNGVLTDRIWEVSNIFKALSKIIADAREGLEILQTPHTIIDKQNATTLRTQKGEIVFHDVSFGYGNEEIFSHLNLTIKPYEKIGIVGVSGSGKSTLTKLLMRLYDVQSGDIRIDGQSIRDVTQESLHQSIALVPQDTVLFHRSLAENIRYAQPHISEADFGKYCRIARCNTFVEKLPDGYETLVGERGIKLSGGERQRVAIARALIAETPIIIFDEATSALDSESEKYIQEAMFDAIEGKTALVIAHRLSTIVHLDRILVFDGGKIIEDGSHTELMKQGGTYAKLWTIQSGEFRE